MSEELRIATWKDRVQYFLGRRIGIVVDGSSMSPALRDGDAVLVDPHVDPIPGDIVLAKHPFKSELKILKRLDNIDGVRYFLIGDNPEESTDSRTLGEFSRASIVGKVVCRLKSARRP